LKIKAKTSFPDKNWNSWEIAENTSNDKFVGVLTKILFEDKFIYFRYQKCNVLKQA
jgi:hypothetical protein